MTEPADGPRTDAVEPGRAVVVRGSASPAELAAVNVALTGPPEPSGRVRADLEGWRHRRRAALVRPFRAAEGQ